MYILPMLTLVLRQELRGAVSEKLPDDHVEVAVYPKYETTGDLAQCTAKFVEWYVFGGASNIATCLTPVLG